MKPLTFMKKLALLTLVICAVQLNTIAQIAIAQSLTQNSETREGPCVQIMEACKAAGYTKNISRTCMRPLLDGKSVDKVNLPASVISECKAKKIQLKTEK